MQVRKFVNDVSLLFQIIVILVKKKDLNIYLNFLDNSLPLLTCEQPFSTWWTFQSSVVTLLRNR